MPLSNGARSHAYGARLEFNSRLDNMRLKASMQPEAYGIHVVLRQRHLVHNEESVLLRIKGDLERMVDLTYRRWRAGR